MFHCVCCTARLKSGWQYTVFHCAGWKPKHAVVHSHQRRSPFYFRCVTNPTLAPVQLTALPAGHGSTLLQHLLVPSRKQILCLDIHGATGSSLNLFFLFCIYKSGGRTSDWSSDLSAFGLLLLCWLELQLPQEKKDWLNLWVASVFGSICFEKDQISPLSYQTFVPCLTNFICFLWSTCGKKRAGSCTRNSSEDFFLCTRVRQFQRSFNWLQQLFHHIACERDWCQNPATRLGCCSRVVPSFSLTK